MTTASYGIPICQRFTAGASLHYLHDNFYWALLPSKDIVERYFNALVEVGGGRRTAKRKAFPTIEVI